MILYRKYTLGNTYIHLIKIEYILPIAYRACYHHVQCVDV